MNKESFSQVVNYVLKVYGLLEFHLENRFENLVSLIKMCFEQSDFYIFFDIRKLN